jgi:alkylation response protein AidB-like acyl-CoA dehydrogenase
VRERLYSVPLAVQACVPHAAVAIGIARAAVEDLVDLASAKTPLMSATTLRERSTVQHAVAEADASVRGARALIRAAVADAWLDPGAIGQLSLAATHVTHTCVRAVDLMYAAAGGTSVYSSSPLQRRFRDLHVAASHYLVNDDKYTQAGRMLLGAEA